MARRSPSFLKARKERFAFAKNRCEVCNAGPEWRLECHHRGDQSYEKDNRDAVTMNDVLIVCVRHHDAITDVDRRHRFAARETFEISKDEERQTPRRTTDGVYNQVDWSIPASDAQQSNGQSARPVKAEDSSDYEQAKNTDADYAEICRLEFLAGLYIDDDGPYIPNRCLRKMLIEAARKDKNGKQFEQGLFVNGDARLEYDGPKTAEELFNAEKENGDLEYVWTCVVGNQRNSIMRTRPIFNDWSCQFSVDVETSLVDEEMLKTALSKADISGGICDARSIGYGRFRTMIL